MSLRRQLLLVSLLVLVLPWMGYLYVAEMERALRDAQADALLTTTRALALLAAEDLPPAGDAPAVFAHRLQRPIIVDGYDSDWFDVAARAQSVGFSGDRRDRGQAVEDSPMRLVIGAREEALYLLLEARDESIRYFNPSRQQVNGDRILLRLRVDGRWSEYVYLTSAPGLLSARVVREREPQQHVPALQAAWRETTQGFRLELVLPNVVQFDELAIYWIDSDPGKPPRWWGNAPNFNSEQGVAVQRPRFELAARMRDFLPPGTRVRVVNDRQQVVADVANNSAIDAVHTDGLLGAMIQRLVRFLLRRPDQRDLPFRFEAERLRDGDLVRAARLDGWASDWYQLDRFASAVVVAAVSTGTGGMLIAEQSSDSEAEITGLALTRLVTVTFLAAVVVAATLLGFASWLSWRIRRLRNSVERSVDEYGVVQEGFVASGARDEIGDLSRGYGKLLDEVRASTSYLRNLARSLSHELRTPLAVVSSSLDNLGHEALSPQARVYAQRAQQGAVRLRAILLSMSEATRVEQAIESGERQPLQPASLLADVLPGYRDVYPHCRFDLQVSDAAASLTLAGVPELLAQMLDKLIDNAAGFVPAGGLVSVSCDAAQGRVVITICNDGPLLPDTMQNRLFEPMVSLGRSGDNSPHLGFGLYIVKLIAELHDGSVAIANREDRKGVAVTVSLPVRGQHATEAK